MRTILVKFNCLFYVFSENSVIQLSVRFSIIINHSLFMFVFAILRIIISLVVMFLISEICIRLFHCENAFLRRATASLSKWGHTSHFVSIRQLFDVQNQIRAILLIIQNNYTRSVGIF